MKIVLTEEQLKGIKNNLDELTKEGETLREKKKTEYVSGWDLINIENQRLTLMELLVSKEIDTSMMSIN